ncbi:hypothetical protein ACLKA6_004631 [Drosophila palustris]
MQQNRATKLKQNQTEPNNNNNKDAFKRCKHKLKHRLAVEVFIWPGRYGPKCTLSNALGGSPISGCLQLPSVAFSSSQLNRAAASKRRLLLKAQPSDMPGHSDSS